MTTLPVSLGGAIIDLPVHPFEQIGQDLNNTKECFTHFYIELKYIFFYLSHVHEIQDVNRNPAHGINHCHDFAPFCARH